MKNHLLAALSVTLMGLATLPESAAQSGAVAQMYGQGVHAYYAGNQSAAREYLSMAINNGSDDPRAYYFRGMVAYAQGSTYEAESDWQQGARLEAQGTANPFIGRSLTRFQGSGRLKLEEIRQKARLEQAVVQAARSNQRAQEITGSEIRNRVINPSATPAPAAAAPEAGSPPAPPSVSEDPFAENLAEGDANVTEEDALEGAMDDPFGDDPAMADGPVGDDGADPFSADGGADPFAADGADPFAEEGNGGLGAEEADPFGDVTEGPVTEDPFE